MHKPSLLALAMLALVGCATDPVDGDLDTGKGDGDPDDPSTLAVTWRIDNFARGEEIGCGSHDLAVAKVVYETFDSTGESTAEPVVVEERFDCADGRAAIPKIDAGEYAVSIDFEDQFGFWAGSALRFITVDGQTQPRLDEHIYEDAGYLSVGWKLVGADSGKFVSCEQLADMDGFEVVFTKSGSTDLVSDRFDCTKSPFGDITDALAAGDYVVSIDAFDEQTGTALAISDPFTTTIQAPNLTTVKGIVPVKVPGM